LYERSPPGQLAFELALKIWVNFCGGSFIA
jgi:hypothetical protein